MQSFFEKPDTEKTVTKAERKQLVLETNTLFNGLIDDYIKENYDDMSDQLRSKKGYNDKEIEEFFPEFRRELQIKFFEQFKEALREEVLSSQKTSSVDHPSV